MMTSKIVTMTCQNTSERVANVGGRGELGTVTIAPMMVSITAAIAEMMALMPEPMAETMEP